MLPGNMNLEQLNDEAAHDELGKLRSRSSFKLYENKDINILQRRLSCSGGKLKTGGINAKAVDIKLSGKHSSRIIVSPSHDCITQDSPSLRHDCITFSVRKTSITSSVSQHSTQEPSSSRHDCIASAVAQYSIREPFAVRNSCVTSAIFQAKCRETEY